MLDYENLGYADSANKTKRRYPNNDKYMKGYLEQQEELDVLKSGDDVAITLNGKHEYYKFNYRAINGTLYIFLSVCNGTISLLNIKHILAKGYKGRDDIPEVLVYKKSGVHYNDYLTFLLDNGIVSSIVEENEYVFECSLSDNYILKG
ncbi:hypothetical protein RND61_14785 [Streptomyces sp. TRM76323]|uniref:Uncharacterized protein n=1 Tax=Streptomyces tamarix TaxID=3078565 RepID=A0ABU3QLL8_9ACTN|nr:hypothetical protein [Streptomyces tamarix]MDT9683329.1 hypothetical protein [Streptomyces tamarix]